MRPVRRLEIAWFGGLGRLDFDRLGRLDLTTLRSDLIGRRESHMYDDMR